MLEGVARAVLVEVEENHEAVWRHSLEKVGREFNVFRRAVLPGPPLRRLYIDHAAAVVLHAKGRNSRARTGDYNRSSSRRRRADGDDDDDASAIERLESSARSSRSSAYDAKKLAKVRARARTEAREEAAAREAFETKYAARQRQGLPQVVTDRMLERVGVFCGTPLIFGFATGPAFYYAKAVRGIDVPSWVFFTASTATFGAAVVGISYGVLSASWDPRREGSFWGFAEFKENVPIVVSTIMGKARGEVPLEWDDETDEDF